MDNEKSYLRIARCIYSGSEGYYDLKGKHWTYEKQQNLNLKFMKEECNCKRCTSDRADRKALVEALRRDRNYDALKMLGEAK